MRLVEQIAGWGAVLLFVLIGGTMNFMFASTLGTNEFQVWLWRGLSIGATLFTAAGLSIIVRACRAHDRRRAVAAAIILSLSVTYDVLAAYGFSSTQHTITSFDSDTTARQYREAGDAVTRATADLEPYKHAPDLQVARQTESALDQELQAIDKLPGVITKAGPCIKPSTAAAIQSCPRRSELAIQLRKATSTRISAEAKDRYSAALKAAQDHLNATRAPRPADPRAAVLGSWLTEWLPVALLTLGGLLGFYAVSSTAPTTDRSSPKAPSAQPGRPKDAQPRLQSAAPLPQPVRPRTVRQPNPGADRLIEALTSIADGSGHPDLFVDTSGWVKGSQRAMARATGYKTLSGFNRVLHAAAAADLLDLDTTGNRTAVRLRVNEPVG